MFYELCPFIFVKESIPEQNLYSMSCDKLELRSTCQHFNPCQSLYTYIEHTGTTVNKSTIHSLNVNLFKYDPPPPLPPICIIRDFNLINTSSKRLTSPNLHPDDHRSKNSALQTPRPSRYRRLSRSLANCIKTDLTRPSKDNGVTIIGRVRNSEFRMILLYHMP